MKTPPKALSLPEFVVLLAMMISIVAFSTDAILPAFEQVSDDLGLKNPNDAQLLISSMFLGFAFGQITMGPLSDSYGRKPIIYFSYGIFLIGCLISTLADNYELMLIGRVLQGFGAAGPRTIGTALIRDLYSGRTMARIMSIVMAVFIVAPAIAPALGQGILALSNWRFIFIFLFVNALIALIWFGLRQPETLAVENRRALSFSDIIDKTKQVLKLRQLTGYTLATGVIFGAFLGYLNSAQQIFQVTYEKGQLFAIYFGVAALAIGASSIYNSKVVEKFGMRLLTMRALIVLIIAGFAALFLSLSFNGVPPFWIFMAWQFITFCCLGMVFGNLNALAMEPVGDMAGLGAAIVGFTATIISLPFGWLVGTLYDGTVMPLIGGFAIHDLFRLPIIISHKHGKSIDPLH